MQGNLPDTSKHNKTKGCMTCIYIFGKKRKKGCTSPGSKTKREQKQMNTCRQHRGSKSKTPLI